MEKDYLSNKELVNRLKEGWQVGKDYLIRNREGKVVSKWYLNKWGRRIWYPSLDDTNAAIRLKRTWVKLENQLEKYWEQILETTEELKKVGGKAHGKPLHNFSEKEDKDLYWLWEVYEYEGIQTFIWKWVRKPTELFNIEIGQKMCEQYYYYYHTIVKRTNLFKSALDEIIKNKLPNPEKLKIGTKYIVKIEELDLYYVVEPAPTGESKLNVWTAQHFSPKPPNILEIK